MLSLVAYVKRDENLSAGQGRVDSPWCETGQGTAETWNIAIMRTRNLEIAGVIRFDICTNENLGVTHCSGVMRCEEVRMNACYESLMRND